MAKVVLSSNSRSWMATAYRAYAGFLTNHIRSYQTSRVLLESEPQTSKKQYANITFVLPDREITVKAEVGQTFLDIILDNNIDIDGYGACEGTLACSTCHLIFTPSDFSRIEKEQRKISDDEEDMLDLAKGRTESSRLGCQVKIAPWMEGVKITVPSSSDARVG